MINIFEYIFINITGKGKNSWTHMLHVIIRDSQTFSVLPTSQRWGFQIHQVPTSHKNYIFLTLHKKFTPQHAVCVTQALSFMLTLSPCSNSPTHTTPPQQHIPILTICFPGYQYNWLFKMLALPAPKTGFIYGIPSHLGDIGSSSMCTSTNWWAS